MKLRYRQTHTKSGDRLELVERASGMTQSAAADHGDKKPAGRHQWGKHQRSLVANAAGGMLIDFLSGKKTQIE